MRKMYSKVYLAVDEFAKASDDKCLMDRLDTLRREAELQRRRSQSSYLAWLEKSEGLVSAGAQCLGYICALMKYDVINLDRYECFYRNVVDIANGKGVDHA